MGDLSPYEIEQRLRSLYNQLAQVRENLNRRADDYQSAAAEFKTNYAKAFLEARMNTKTIKEAEMKAQQFTASEEARYKATEQLVLNERKAVDALIAQVDIARSLYAKATREEEYYRKGAGD